VYSTLLPLVFYRILRDIIIESAQTFAQREGGWFEGPTRY